MSWEEVPFESLYAVPSRNGVYKTKEHHGEGTRIVNMGELFAYDTISDQEMKRLQMSEAELEVSGLANGDLLFGRRSLVEAGAGKSSIVEGLTEPTTFESSIIRVRLDPTQANPRFYFYWLRSHIGKGRIAFRKATRAYVSSTGAIAVLVRRSLATRLSMIPAVHSSVAFASGCVSGTCEIPILKRLA